MTSHPEGRVSQSARERVIYRDAAQLKMLNTLAVGVKKIGKTLIISINVCLKTLLRIQITNTRLSGFFLIPF